MVVADKHVLRALNLLDCPHARGRAIGERVSALRLRPHELATMLEKELSGLASRIVVNGTFDRRVILLEAFTGPWIACSLSDEPLGALPWPLADPDHLAIDAPAEPVSHVRPSLELLDRLCRPNVLIVGLYHPENFPLPRFPLGISDLARAVRSTMSGQVRLLDMQLGLDVDDIRRHIIALSPDILGISATFGQHDVLMEVMQVLHELTNEPLIVFGGSLCALNSRMLLAQFPDAMVCHGPGEPTMQDVVAWWHRTIGRSEVRSVSISEPGPLPVPRTPLNREYLDIIPELDLLERTLECKGVMQLESSRGCTHACSFCPRSHKGRWTGHSAQLFQNVLAEVDRVYGHAPQISRKLFLVDEEFVGSDKNGDALARATNVCNLLHGTGFRWETSTRVDQVYRADRDRDWHLERIRFWSHLRDHGLSRCLFGVESGVDSVLQRFNKHTSAEQNALAIRLLTALGVPIRCTFITFDQLMTLDELVATYRFQGREDVIISVPHPLSPDELFDAVQDGEFVAHWSVGLPFYTTVSYMLVSMEALIGSPYLRRLEAAGLAGAWEPSMGRRHAQFADRRIGVMSAAAQLWVDRNFSLDYTLKSLEKISEGPQQSAARAARGLLKRSSYQLLGRMLAITTGDISLLDHGDVSGGSLVDGTDELTNDSAERLLQESFEELVEQFEDSISMLRDTLDGDRWEVAEREHRRWNARMRWEVING